MIKLNLNYPKVFINLRNYFYLLKFYNLVRYKVNIFLINDFLKWGYVSEYDSYVYQPPYH